MSPSPPRIELRIDVFEAARQLALARSDLNPPQLVKAILQEFHSLEYLTDEPGDYYLVRADTGEPLAEPNPLAQQVKSGDHLVLVQREAPLPVSTQRPSQPLYLRDALADKTYPLHWLPAIIGRSSEHQPSDEPIAIDLRANASGLRVSRRHVRLTETAGQLYAENLANNAASLLSARQPEPVALATEPQPIFPGDIIRLDRSGIELKLSAASRAPAAGNEALIPHSVTPEGRQISE